MRAFWRTGTTALVRTGSVGDRSSGSSRHGGDHWHAALRALAMVVGIVIAISLASSLLWWFAAVLERALPWVVAILVLGLFLASVSATGSSL